MPDAVKVSILMLAYNHERFIEQAVRSVLAQRTDFDFEVVVGEDCSTDRTRSILHRLAAEAGRRLRILERESNVGGPRNFVEAYGACSGEYLAILEGDDYWVDPNKLARQAAALDRNPHWSLCFHRAARVDESNRTCGCPFPRRVPRETTTEDIISVNYVPTCSIMLRRSAVPNLPDWWCETSIGDWPLCILAGEQGALGFLPQVMACYRSHGQATYSSRPKRDQLERCARLMRILQRHFGQRYQRQLMALEASYSLALSSEMALAGQADAARQTMAEAWAKASHSAGSGSSLALVELALAALTSSRPLNRLLDALRRLKIFQVGGGVLLRLCPRYIDV
jgi:hypothetical protein